MVKAVFLGSRVISFQMMHEYSRGLALHNPVILFRDGEVAWRRIVLMSRKAIGRMTMAKCVFSEHFLAPAGRSHWCYALAELLGTVVVIALIVFIVRAL